MEAVAGGILLGFLLAKGTERPGVAVVEPFSQEEGSKRFVQAYDGKTYAIPSHVPGHQATISADNIALATKRANGVLKKALEMDPAHAGAKQLLAKGPWVEESSFVNNHSSYTVNKHRICLCTVTKSGSLDDGAITGMLLHELAHCISHTNGHDEEFHKNHNFLRIAANRLNFNEYEPSGF